MDNSPINMVFLGFSKERKKNNNKKIMADIITTDKELLRTCVLPILGRRNSNEAFEYFVNNISLMNFCNANPPTSQIPVTLAVTLKQKI